MWIPREFASKIPGTGLDMTSSEFNQKNPAELSEQLNIFDILGCDGLLDELDARKVSEADFEDYEEPLGEL